MKESTHNLTLIARGACLGYAIAMLIFSIFLACRMYVPLWFLSFIISFYGMALGIVTELSLSKKSFREKLAVYIAGISLNPPMLTFAVFILFDYIPSLASSSIFYLLFLLFLSIFLILGVLYFKKATFPEFVAYFVGYFTVFLCFILIVLLSTSHILSFGRLDGILTFTALSFISSTTSVSLTKLFFSKIKKV